MPFGQLAHEIVEPLRPRPRLRGSARAKELGWRVDCDPAANTARPHDGSCPCPARTIKGEMSWCRCSCHGAGGARTFTDDKKPNQEQPRCLRPVGDA